MCTASTFLVKLNLINYLLLQQNGIIRRYLLPVLILVSGKRKRIDHSESESELESDDDEYIQGELLAKENFVYLMEINLQKYDSAKTQKASCNLKF